MATPSEIEEKFWKALKSDMTVMLGMVGREGGEAQPMTAQVGDRQGRGPIWFFSARDVDLVEAMGSGAPATLQFASKGHDLFASVEGFLLPDDDRAKIDELWSPFAAAWYEQGKEDPKLRLIRFDPTAGRIWLNENSLFAGMKMLLGSDPKKDYADKIAELDFQQRNAAQWCLRVSTRHTKLAEGGTSPGLDGGKAVQTAREHKISTARKKTSVRAVTEGVFLDCKRRRPLAGTTQDKVNKARSKKLAIASSNEKGRGGGCLNFGWGCLPVLIGFVVLPLGILF